MTATQRRDPDER